MLTYYGCREVLTWVSVFACLISFSRGAHHDLWCPTASDETFHGTVVDCTSRGLLPSDLPILDIPVNNTTSLLLDHNNLPYIINGSFYRLQKLRRLQIDYSGITHLEIDAFDGLAGLQILSLYGNSLNIVLDAVPFGVFGSTPLLQELNIGFNPITAGSGNYSSFIDIFDSLHELRYICISSFPTLYIGREFEKLKKLERLEVDGHFLLNILNNSLEGLQYSNIKHFKISSAKPYEFGREVFNSLPYNLRSLTLDTVLVGNNKLLGVMEPLQGKKIPVLNFNNVCLPPSVSRRTQIDDGIIDYENLRYLLNICVSHLTWTNSNLMSFDMGLKLNSTFASCIKSLDISGNKIQLYRLSMLYTLISLHVLEEFRLSSDGLPKHTVNFWNGNEVNFSKTFSQADYKKLGIQIDSPLVSLMKESKNIYSSSPLSSPSISRNEIHQEKADGEYLQLKNRHKLKGIDFILPNHDGQDSALPSTSSRNNIGLPFTSAKIEKTSLNRSLYIFLPKNLKYASFDAVRGAHIGASYDHMIFAQPNKLTELYFRSATRFARIKSSFLGLPHMRLLDLTGTLIEKIPVTAFDFVPSLQVLVLSKTQKDPNFLQIHGDRLIRNIANLVYLDLSDNGLGFLPKGIFQENRALRYLCLAKNRFSSVPFQIQLTPSLEILDLRMNAFSTLDKNEQRNIDEHIVINRPDNFTVLLEENNLQCICSDLLFQAWMQRTHTRFDPKERLTCLGEDGKSVKIELFSDIEPMWRKCVGQYSLLLSLLLLSAMLIMYLAVFLISMYRIYIIGKLKQIFVPEFQRQTRQDFTYDVFIGYANQETAFVRFQLLRYLEGVLKLNAFAHQRDLRQDLLDLGTALKDSWRTLLVISEAFLAHEMSENIMKTATFFESPSKQESIIVMVTQDLLYTIPDYVLRVVKDENIIVLPDFETPFSYEATETLRTRILY